MKKEDDEKDSPSFFIVAFFSPDYNYIPLPLRVLLLITVVVFLPLLVAPQINEASLKSVEVGEVIMNSTFSPRNVSTKHISDDCKLAQLEKNMNVSNTTSRGHLSYLFLAGMFYHPIFC